MLRPVLVVCVPRKIKDAQAFYHGIDLQPEKVEGAGKDAEEKKKLTEEDIKQKKKEYAEQKNKHQEFRMQMESDGSFVGVVVLGQDALKSFYGDSIVHRCSRFLSWSGCRSNFGCKRRPH